MTSDYTIWKVLHLAQSSSIEFVPAPCFVSEVALELMAPATATRGESSVEMDTGDPVRAAASLWEDGIAYLFCWPASEAGAPVHLAWVHRAALHEV